MAPMVSYQVVEFGQPFARRVATAPVPNDREVLLAVEVQVH